LGDLNRRGAGQRGVFRSRAYCRQIWPSTKTSGGIGIGGNGELAQKPRAKKSRWGNETVDSEIAGLRRTGKIAESWHRRVARRLGCGGRGNGKSGIETVKEARRSAELRAKPIPVTFFLMSFWVLRPMTSPRELRSGPPELPGLMERRSGSKCQSCGGELADSADDALGDAEQHGVAGLPIASTASPWGWRKDRRGEEGGKTKFEKVARL